MKTRLLLSAILLLTAGFLYSQNLVLSHEGETLGPNAQITVEGSSASAEIIVELDVTNTGNSSIYVLCQRYELNMVPYTMSAICWGGLCYPPNTSLSPLGTTIGPGVTVENDFSGHYYPQNHPGVSTIAYTFFDQDHPDDSVMVTVLFDGLTVGVNESGKSGLLVYPNPADDQIRLEWNSEGAVTIQLIDLNGSIVREIRTIDNQAKIYTEDISEGVYLYRVFLSDRLISSDKIIVKH
jgi:hypothetical protein